MHVTDLLFIFIVSYSIYMVELLSFFLLLNYKIFEVIASGIVAKIWIVLAWVLFHLIWRSCCRKPWAAFTSSTFEIHQYIRDLQPARIVQVSDAYLKTENIKIWTRLILVLRVISLLLHILFSCHIAVLSSYIRLNVSYPQLPIWVYNCLFDRFVVGYYYFYLLS